MTNKKLEFETVLVQGLFHFIGNIESNFQGPIKNGFRPILWYNSKNKATSCSFFIDGEILQGERKKVKIIVLNQLALGHKIEEGMTLNIGSTKYKIGELKVTKHLGYWHGDKIP